MLVISVRSIHLIQKFASCVQILMTDLITRELSVNITCFWWTILMPNIPDLSVNFIKPRFSAKKSGIPSTLRWYRSLRMRSCCRCSVARPTISLTSSSTHWTTLDNDTSAITSQDDNVSWFVAVALQYQKRTIARSTRVSRWRAEKIAETRMFWDVAGMNAVTEQM